MDCNQFRMLALSNASMDKYPNNKPQSFRYNVEPITLEGQWEVGLSDFTYPATWYNITEDSIFNLKYIYGVAAPGPEAIYGGPYMGGKMNADVLFPKGYYPSTETIIAKLIECVNKRLVEWMKMNVDPRLYPDIRESLAKVYKKFEATDPWWKNRRELYLADSTRTNVLDVLYKKNTQRVKLLPQHRDMVITIKQGLQVWNKLGFQFTIGTSVTIPWHGLVSPKEVSLNLQYPLIYVCTDVVDTTVVGNKERKLLRCVHAPESKNGYQNVRYPRPLFTSVNKGYISTLEFWLEDEDQQLIPFEAGKVILTLKFRRV